MTEEIKTYNDLQDEINDLKSENQDLKRYMRILEIDLRDQEKSLMDKFAMSAMPAFANTSSVQRSLKLEQFGYISEMAYKWAYEMLEARKDAKKYKKASTQEIKNKATAEDCYLNHTAQVDGQDVTRRYE